MLVYPYFNKMNDLYYCYSKKLHYFLMSLDEKYISSSINKNTNTRYWTFKKSERLDEKIALWNEIKHKVK